MASLQLIVYVCVFHFFLSPEVVEMRVGSLQVPGERAFSTLSLKRVDICLDVTLHLPGHNSVITPMLFQKGMLQHRKQV